MNKFAVASVYMKSTIFSYRRARGSRPSPGLRVYPQIRMAPPFREEPPLSNFSRNDSLRPGESRADCHRKFLLQVSILC